MVHRSAHKALLFSMSFKVRFLVGFGAYGFTAGPFLTYGTSIGISKNSSIIGPGMGRAGFPVCRSATFAAELHAGLGYSLNRVVVAFVISGLL